MPNIHISVIDLLYGELCCAGIPPAGDFSLGGEISAITQID